MTPARLLAAVLALRLGVAEARLKGGKPEKADEKRLAPPALCAEELVQETCALLSDDGASAMPTAVAELLAATPEAVAKLWTAEALPAGEAVQCDALCRGTTALLEKLGRHVPPASDTGCYNKLGEIVCDVDLSPPAVARAAASGSGDFAFNKGEEADGVPMEPMGGNESAKKWEPEPSVFDYTTADLAARVAHLFRIYPALGEEGFAVDQLLSTKGSDEVSETLLETRLGQSIAYVNLAIRTFPVHGTRAEVKLFFGEAATTSKPIRKKILSVLNSISNVLGHVSFQNFGSACRPTTFGYVYPCHDSPQERDASGRFKIFICGAFWKVAEEQICTIVHEASHHASACTEDIMYGARQCMAMASHNPSYALLNADNYGYYIREVAQNRGTF